MGRQGLPASEKQWTLRAPAQDRMARLAHELNAPVSLIAGSLENLEHCLASLRRYIAATTGHRETDAGLENAYREFGVDGELAAAGDLLAICREGVGRIGVLSTTFGVSTRCTPSPGTLDLASVVRRAANFACAARPVRSSVELDLDTTPAYEGDLESLSSAFINLIVNALDAVADRQRPLVRVSLRYDPTRHVTEFRVRDNGPGIDPESKPRIFESFYTTKAWGSGLGLAIVREALDRHHGSIEVVSHEGEGAEFIVRLPMPKTVGREKRRTGVLG